MALQGDFQMTSNRWREPALVQAALAVKAETPELIGVHWTYVAADLRTQEVRNRNLQAAQAPDVAAWVADALLEGDVLFA